MVRGSFFDDLRNKKSLVWSQFFITAVSTSMLHRGTSMYEILKESHSIDNNVVECLLETGVELLERSRRGL